MKICTKCNKKWPKGKFCEDCGGPLKDEVQELLCPSCKTKLNAGAKFCPECGAEVDTTDVSSSNDYKPGEEEFDEAWDLMYSDDADEADFPRAFELFKESAEKSYGESYFWLARCYDVGMGCNGNNGYAVYWYEKAVEYDDDPYAAAGLGVKYLFGRGITKDEHKAFQLFKKSAAKNNVNGYFWLGWCSINGAGCEVNEKRAYQNFHLAVKNDYGSSAKFWLAKCYEQGWGCEQNSKKAFELYKQSAEEGNADGRYQVGLCFLYGFGCDKDEDYGIQLIREAAEEGADGAQEFIDKANSKPSKSNKGTIGGAATGAAIGTAILPGVGTVIGGVLGGLFGNKVIDES